MSGSRFTVLRVRLRTMSLNTAINAVIALIEDETDLAKELFRGPNSDVRSIPEVVNRLRRAIDLNMAKGIRRALIDTLKIQPPEGTTANKEDFYAGVAAAEQHFESVATELEHPYFDPDEQDRSSVKRGISST
jgi:hypothetical protein